MKQRRDEAAPVGRGRGTPLHHQVFLVLRNDILAGRPPAGDVLPSEDELSRRFAVSRVTIRSALASLQREGLIEKHQGSGTVVRAQPLRERVRVPNADLLQHVRTVVAATRVRLLEVESVPVPPDLSPFLEAGEQRLLKVTRLRSSRQAPVFHVVTCLPEWLGPFSRQELERRSLFELLSARGIRLSAGRQIVGATLADPVLAGRLQVPVGAALMSIRRLHRDQQGRPIQYIDLHAVPEYFELEMTIDPDGEVDSGTPVA